MNVSETFLMGASYMRVELDCTVARAYNEKAETIAKRRENIHQLPLRFSFFNP